MTDSMTGRWDQVTVRTRLDETKWVRAECQPCEGEGRYHETKDRFVHCEECDGRGWYWKEDTNGD